MTESTREIATKYFDLFYNTMLRDIMGSVTEEEFDTVKTPDKLDINLEYSEFKEAIENGVSQAEVDETIDHLTRFLETYIEFKKEEYLVMLKELFGLALSNVDEVKQKMVEQFEKSKEYDFDEIEERVTKKQKSDEDSDYSDSSTSSSIPTMRSGSNVVLEQSSNQDEETGMAIGSLNEERGVLKVRLGGKDIEVETNGYIVLSNVYFSLFTLFSLINGMTLEHVLSDRPPAYTIMEDEDKFTLRLDRIVSENE
jgi:hypothetical protein